VTKARGGRKPGVDNSLAVTIELFESYFLESIIIVIEWVDTDLVRTYTYHAYDLYIVG
jgi:hypothetical protein